VYIRRLGSNTVHYGDVKAERAQYGQECSVTCCENQAFLSDYAAIVSRWLHDIAAVDHQVIASHEAAHIGTQPDDCLWTSSGMLSNHNSTHVTKRQLIPAVVLRIPVAITQVWYNICPAYHNMLLMRA
jgi:hypothetical protein